MEKQKKGTEVYILGVPKSYIERHARVGETYEAAAKRLLAQFNETRKKRKS